MYFTHTHMMNLFTENRFCFRNEQSDNVRAGDPQWSFGDLPFSSKFQFADGIRDDRTQYTKDGVRDASVRIDSRTVGMVSPHETTPVKNAVIPTVEEVRARYTAIMEEPNYHLPMPATLALAFERETLADVERARIARENGGVPYGPTKNPSDTLREYIDWNDVPAGSFFCFHQKPESRDSVYLLVGSKYVMRICDFGQWVQGFKGYSITNTSKKITDVVDNPSRMKNLKVLVLSAETPEEFERVLTTGKNRPDASPRSEANDAYHDELRAKNAAFWKGVEERTQAS